MVRSMIYFIDLPISFWGYALEIISYVLNRMPLKLVSSIPYELWNDKKPSLKHLRIWGCHAYVKKEFVHKLNARAKKYRFIDYSQEGIGYLFYHPTK